MCQEKSALISFFLFIIFLLTFAHCSYMLLTMETKTVKTYMKRLHRKYKTYDGVADALGISRRYVVYLIKGERIPSDHLRKLIKVMLHE